MFTLAQRNLNHTEATYLDVALPLSKRLSTEMTTEQFHIGFRNCVQLIRKQLTQKTNKGNESDETIRDRNTVKNRLLTK